MRDGAGDHRAADEQSLGAALRVIHPTRLHNRSLRVPAPGL